MCLAVGGGAGIKFFLISLIIFATFPQLLPPEIPYLVSSAPPDRFQVKVNFSFLATPLSLK